MSARRLPDFPSPVLAAMTSRIKLLGRMDLIETRRPAVTAASRRLTPEGGEVELRLSTMPTCVRRETRHVEYVNPDVLVKDFARHSDFPTKTSKNERHDCDSLHGIVLVTGPTGSGKTTTLYSSMKYTRPLPEVNVCTVEDPIEMVENRNYNQMQVQQNTRCRLRGRHPHADAAEIPISSWSAKSAIWRPRKWRSRRR